MDGVANPIGQSPAGGTQRDNNQGGRLGLLLPLVHQQHQKGNKNNSTTDTEEP